MPRGGVVNARRRGQGPGRSGAESIDEAEHGTSIICAMMARLNLNARRRHVLPMNRARAPTDFCGSRSTTPQHRSGQPGGAIVRTIWARKHGHARHDQRWRERPRQGNLGSDAGHGGGVVHAIVGAVTSTRTLLDEAADSAARGRARDNIRRVKRLPALRAHGQPGVRDCPEKASQPGGQPDAIFAWPPVWPRHRDPSCR